MIIQSTHNPITRRAAAPSTKPESNQVSGDSFQLSQQQPPTQQPPAQQPPAQQPVPPQQPAAPPQPELKDWTVLVYSVSDNNLYTYMQSDLDEAERVGSTNEMTVLAETSHQPRGGNVVRMKLETDSTPGLTSPVLQDLGKTHDMARSENLANSIAWAMKEYPSKHFFLVCSDHGAGWKGAHHAESTDSWMNATDLESALKSAQEQTGRKIDVIGFDECLMASAEIGHQLKDYASYMVASEEVEGGAGWQYDQALGKQSNTNSRVISGKVLNYAAAALRARDPLTPADMAKAVVSMAEGHQRDLGTMSAIDLSKMGNVSAALDNFAGKVIDANIAPKDFAPVAQAAQKFYDFADAGHLVELAGAKFGGEIADAAAGVKAALGEAVIAEQHSQKYPKATGLNIEYRKQAAAPGLTDDSQIPNMDPDAQSRMKMNPYHTTKFAQETRWDEMLRKVR